MFPSFQALRSLRIKVEDLFVCALIQNANIQSDLFGVMHIGGIASIFYIKSNKKAA